MLHRVIKPLFVFFALALVLRMPAQISMYRCFPQTPPFGSYAICEFQKPVKTSDNGYIFSFFPWSPNLHGAYPYDHYVIKTDSNFIPQWKKPYYTKAISLPTGGIILIYNTTMMYNLYNGMTIEKITPNGTQVWIKQYAGENMVLNDGVCYGNKIRFVGRKRGNNGFPFFGETAQAYTLLMDTSGNFISHSLFDNSYNGNADFSRIHRTPQGDFLVYSVMHAESASDMALAKFDSSFTFMWGRKGILPNTPLALTDLDVLSSGNIVATGTQGYLSSLFKFDGQGNLLSQSYINYGSAISGLCKKGSGNYLVSSAIYNSNSFFLDSLFLFEMDTAMNILWRKHYTNYGLSTGTSLIKQDKIYTQVLNNMQPFIFSSDTLGNNCSSSSGMFSRITSTLQLASFTMTAVASTAIINPVIFDTLMVQTYGDSCRCAPSIAVVPGNNLCVGATATLTSTGSYPVSWYNTPVGNTFISPGAQFLISSGTPTVRTVYAQDSICAIPNRVPVTFTFNAVPVLTLSASSSSICSGTTVTLTAQGAPGYSLNGLTAGPSITVSPLGTTVYSVTGASAPGCSSSQTIGISVVATPTLNTPLSNYLVCAGSSTVLSVSGANTYFWTTGATSSSITVSPPAGMTNYTVWGYNGLCSATTTVLVFSVFGSAVTITGSSPAFCPGNSYTLSASAYAVNTFTWNNAAVTTSLVITPTASAVYTVDAINSAGCASSNTFSVGILPNPTISINPPNPVVCQGTPVSFTAGGAATYSWSNGTTSPSLSLVPAASGTYSLMGWNANNCAATGVVSVTVNSNPVITIAPSTLSICYGNTTTLTANGASNYSWTTGAASAAISLSPAQTASYAVTGSNANGCSNMAVITITVNPLPVVYATANTSAICPGDSAVLVAGGANSYLWNTGSSLAQITVTPAATASYSVTGTSLDNCSASAVITIPVNPSPQISVNSTSPVICAGESVTLSPLGAATYTWSFQTAQPVIVVSPGVTTVYTLSGTDLNGCTGMASFTQSVSVCTGLSENTMPMGILIFPNPTSGSFIIKVDNREGGNTMALYNSLGQSLLEQTIIKENTTIQLQDHAPGVYYLHVKGAANERVFKVVKQ